MTVDELAQPAAERGEPLVLAIGGMTCGACAARIERRLNAIEGLEATVNFASERATVASSGGVAIERVVDEIRSIGFSAEPVASSEQRVQRAEADQRVRSLGQRLVVAALLFMPLCDLSFASSVAPAVGAHYLRWLLVVLAAPVLTWCAWPFYSAAFRAARHGSSTMDTLVSVGILASTGWSVYAMFWRPASHVQQIGFFNLVHNNGNAGYLDVGVGVTTFLLAGRFFEATAKRRTGNALHSLATVQAKDVAVLDASGAEHRLPIGELRIGDRFVVRPGETIATDGVVITGRSAVDRSLLTGESVPQDVGPGDEVVGGTVSVAGRLVVLASTVGSATQLAQIARLVEDAQNQKAAIQRLGDRIAGIFVPAVLALATFTLVVWLASGGTPDHAFSAALSVLIVACPCAIGLATPTALLVATGRGARLGIFFKGYQGIEISRHIDTVVLDKTGTVTEGRMRVVDVAGAPGVGRAELLRWAGALEQASEHAIAQAITDLAVQELGSLPLVEHFEAEPGLGARGVVGGHQICVGRSELFSTSLSLLETTIAERCSVWQALGRSAVLVGRDDVVVGAIALADTVRPSAAPAVADLQALGLRCLLLTGDNEHTARAVAESIGVTDVIANTLPADKVGVIRRLQQQGRSVAMIGDGINDAPALASADLGIAVGSGTDVAMNAADLIIVRVDLQVAAMAVNLARQTLKTIRRNLLWAFGYNLVALPLAAVGLLNPLIAGAAMALSSSFVVWNSSRLGRQSIRTSM